MWRYLKAAFWAQPELPGLGAMPLNAVAMGAFGILGFMNAGFWFLGLGLEVAYLWLLAGNARFRRMVDTQDVQAAEPDRAKLTRDLVAGLSVPARARLTAIERQCERIIELQRANTPDAYLLDSNRDALDRLRWTYLKLLVADANLRSPEWSEGEDKLRARLADLDRDLAAPGSDSVRETKLATRDILAKRLANRAERSRHLTEIAADLDRIEAQIELARENAQIQGRPLSIAGEVELASTMLDFGSSAPAVGDLDRAYSPPAAAKPQGTSS